MLSKHQLRTMLKLQNDLQLKSSLFSVSMLNDSVSRLGDSESEDDNIYEDNDDDSKEEEGEEWKRDF